MPLTPTRQTSCLMRSVSAAALCVSLLLVAPPPAQAASHPKIAPDLARLIDGADTADKGWAKSVGGQMYAKVLVSASSSDPDLVELRKAVLALNGSVYYVSLSVRTLLALMPVAQLDTLAARSDVLAISPNRALARTGSLVADASGATAVPALGSAPAVAVNGAGVGIAVLDSGIDWNHRHLQGANGKSRVATVVDIVGMSKRLNDNSWARGKDRSDRLASAIRVSGSVACNTAPSSSQPDP